MSYRYIFADLLSNAVIAELPLTGVNYTQALNAAGTATGRILLADLDVQTMNPYAATLPEKTALYVDRDGTIVWGGEIWSQRYDSETGTLEITAREFESYFEKRIITASVSYSGIDQLTVAKALINNAQAVFNGNLNITTGAETSGVLISPSYYWYEQRSVFTALQDLSKTVNGFDFNIFCSYDINGNITKQLRLGYPRYGKVWSATNQNATVVDNQSNIIKYTFDNDGTRGANTIYCTGSGSGENTLQYVAQDATQLAAGYAIHEISNSQSQISDITILTNYAKGQLAAISTPPITFQVVIPASIDPILGSYEIGDDVRVRIIDAMFPNGIDTIYRLTALNVQVGEDSGEQVTMTLTVRTA